MQYKQLAPLSLCNLVYAGHSFFDRSNQQITVEKLVEFQRNYGQKSILVRIIEDSIYIV